MAHKSLGSAYFRYNLLFSCFHRTKLESCVDERLRHVSGATSIKSESPSSALMVVEPADEEDEYSLKEVINNTDCKEQSR